MLCKNAVAYLFLGLSVVALSGCAVNSGQQWLASPAPDSAPRYLVEPANRPASRPAPVVAGQPLPEETAPAVELSPESSPLPEQPALSPAGPRTEIAKPPQLLADFTQQQQANAFFDSAEHHLRSGRQLFADGNLDGARDEFDAAVETLLQVSSRFPDRAAFQRRFDQLLDSIHEYDKALAAQSQEDEPENSESSIPEMTFPVDPRFRDRVIEEIRASAFQIPLVANDTVLGYVEYLTNTRRGRATFVNGMERAGRYREMIHRIFDEEGVPRELIHLAQAESGFRANAVSPARATGMWQFMKFRGNEYGLGQSKYSDDRMDPEKATRAAARHLLDLYNEFGDWHLAMAAYNCGPVNVSRAVERTGYADFWEMRRLNVLPGETKNYVPMILAMAIVAKNPEKYGFDTIELHRPVDYDKVELAAPTHLQLAADLAETTLTGLRALNPSLLADVAPAGYTLHVPKGKGMMVQQSLDLVPAARRAQWRVHLVKEGEDLAQVARLYRVTVDSIAKTNDGAAFELEPGELLVIPTTLQNQKVKTARKPLRKRPATASRKTRARPRA